MKCFYRTNVYSEVFQCLLFIEHHCFILVKPWAWNNQDEASWWYPCMSKAPQDKWGHTNTRSCVFHAAACDEAGNLQVSWFSFKSLYHPERDLLQLHCEKRRMDARCDGVSRASGMKLEVVFVQKLVEMMATGLPGANDAQIRVFHNRDERRRRAREGKTCCWLSKRRCGDGFRLQESSGGISGSRSSSLRGSSNVAMMDPTVASWESTAKLGALWGFTALS